MFLAAAFWTWFVLMIFELTVKIDILFPIQSPVPHIKFLH